MTLNGPIHFDLDQRATARRVVPERFVEKFAPVSPHCLLAFILAAAGRECRGNSWYSAGVLAGNTYLEAWKGWRA